MDGRNRNPRLGKLGKLKLGIFHWTIIALLIIYLILRIGVPYFSMLIAKKDQPLPVPNALMAIFILLSLIGAFVNVTYSDQRLAEFIKPIVALLRGKEQAEKKINSYNIVRLLILATVPILFGWLVYSQVAPKSKSPTLLRIQHPTIPGARVYEKLENPFRKADAQTLEKHIADGRILYQTYCRPCHGTKADGKGPIARGFRLKPANFRDPGTIATVVESYAFWRIKEGGIALPSEASPWDSAMPSWKDELTDEQIWKILLAEYDTANVEPRKPE